MEPNKYGDKCDKSMSSKNMKSKDCKKSGSQSAQSTDKSSQYSPNSRQGQGRSDPSSFKR